VRLQKTLEKSVMSDDPREAVYIFQPLQNGFQSIPTTPATSRSEHPRPGSPFDYYTKAKPVPKECVAATFDVAVVNRRMPDFLYYRDSEIIISSRAREALDELAPDTIEYIDIKMNIAASMSPAAAYYYVNVLPAAQIIDWQKSNFPPHEQMERRPLLERE